MAKMLLIIDDEPLITNMYQHLFALEKYDVAISNDGQEGIEIAKKEKPEFILLDIMMPKMNGIEVLEKLKADVSTKDIPVIVLSNLADDQLVGKVMAKGAEKYLVKSDFEPQEVIQICQDLVAKKKKSAEAQS